MFSKRRFLVCVSGGIAVYKVLELVRFLKKQGGEVKVVMSANAQKFVTPLSFETLSENPVLLDGNESWVGGINHIDYASWAEVCILAPATINSINKFAYGIADNVMLSTMLACKAPKIIAPAANTQMYCSYQAQEGISRLQRMQCVIVEPKEGHLACGTFGVGALQEIEEIAYCALREISTLSFWKNQKVIVSGGGSSENIDDVRCISNHSSGLQASYFALALYLLGAEVVFVSSKTPIFLPKSIRIRDVKSTQEFYEAIMDELEGSAYYFGIAALSDFVPMQKREGKIKKDEGLKVDFKQNFDVLQSLKGVKKIGFKAEKDQQNALTYAQEMLKKKECDFVCLNIVGEHNPFGADQNAICLLNQKGECLEFALQDKFSLALEILKVIAND